MIEESRTTNKQPLKRQLNGGDHRDAKGRFAYGHPGGPGRPRRALEQDYLHTLSAACPPERLAGIVERLAVAAERGDQSAIQILLRYLVGNPSAAPTLTQMAIAEMANMDPAEREAKALRFQALGEQYLDAIDL
jgi:aryl-alcohol dehydrogenase-like predicted oxidoreductase